MKATREKLYKIWKEPKKESNLNSNTTKIMYFSKAKINRNS